LVRWGCHWFGRDIDDKSAPLPFPSGSPLKLYTPEVPPAPVTYITHIVGSGDSLSSLAKKYNTTISALVELNKEAHPTLVTNPNLIVDGWVLKVGIQDTTPPTSTFVDLKKGSIDLVRVPKLQQRLVDLGYDCGISDDGGIGQRTETMIRLFQLVSGLEHTLGICNETTWNLLFSTEAKRRPPHRELFPMFLLDTVGYPYVVAGRNSLITKEEDINTTNLRYCPSDHIATLKNFYRNVTVGKYGKTNCRAEDCGSLGDTYMMAFGLMDAYTNAGGTLYGGCDRSQIFAFDKNNVAPVKKGYFVVRDGSGGVQHIGYVVDDIGTVVEASWIDVGIQITHLQGASWTRYGIPRWIDN
jgi:hypothetical protein